MPDRFGDLTGSVVEDAGAVPSKDGYDAGLEHFDVVDYDNQEEIGSSLFEAKSNSGKSLKS